MSNRWPENLILPSADDFSHGCWIDDIDEESSRNGQGLSDRIMTTTTVLDRRLRREAYDAIGREAMVMSMYVCGTRFCLVGWMGMAFGGPYTPSQIILGAALSTPHWKFMEKFVEKVVGISDSRSSYSDLLLMTFASDVFEGSTGRGEMSGCAAESYWIQTARDFGYDC